jgi:hypothetical protein
MTTVLDVVAEAIDEPDAQWRMSLVASQLIGVAMSRHVLCLPPLAGADASDLAAAVAPTLQRHLHGDLGAERPRGQAGREARRLAR